MEREEILGILNPVKQIKENLLENVMDFKNWDKPVIKQTQDDTDRSSTMSDPDSLNFDSRRNSDEFSLSEATSNSDSRKSIHKKEESTNLPIVSDFRFLDEIDFNFRAQAPIIDLKSKERLVSELVHSESESNSEIIEGKLKREDSLEKTDS